MARNGQDQSGPRRRFRALPRLPRIRRGELRAGEEFRKLREGMAATRHACPHDGQPMALLDVFPTGTDGQIPEGSEPMRALVCPECSFTVPISAMKEQLRQQAAPLKRAEHQFTFFGFGILALFGLVAALSGNVLTIVGALLLSLTLFLNALFYRYRHWQAVHGAMFSDEPAVGRWLRDEMSRRRGPPGSR